MGTVDLTDATFDEAVDGSDIVLVDVWAPWCGPCKRFAPIFEQASVAHPDLVFAKLDADAEPGLARRLKIRGIPTLLVYRGATQVRRKLGALSAARLERLIAEARQLDPQQARPGSGLLRGLARFLPSDRGDRPPPAAPTDDR